MNRRIAIISFYQAYPPVSGAASVSYNLAKFISGPTVLIQLGTRDERLVTVDNVAIVTLAGAIESRRERLMRLSGFVRRMTAEITRTQAEVVILEGALWAIYHWIPLRAIRRTEP